ncbi:MAG: SdrD B-like domain-containing protein, partial [Planctomycetota bacterium]
MDNSPTTNFATHIREYTVSSNPDIADPASVREILSFDQPFGNHNGGWIGFSPVDDFLYIGSGDGGSGGDPLGNGQSLNTLLGKMLRIDVDGDDFPADPDANYAIPATNPFVGTAGARDEIWAYGLRNPWRDSFDRVTGDLWIGDVGQNAFEEIDFQAAASSGGENYAWNRREGFSSFNGGVSLPGDVEPVYDYAHGSGPLEGNSVIGGHVYRGQIDAFAGLYIFADSRSSNVWSFNPADPINSVQRINDALVPDAGAIGGGPIPDDIVSFAEDGSGNLYMVEIDGEIHKISMNLPGTHTVLVEAGVAVADIDFGDQDPQASSISNFVWDDLDGDGIQDTGEPGIDGATVNLLNGNTLAQIDSTTTAGGGLYSFGGLAAGDYVVEFVAPGSFLFSPQDQGTDDLLDSDADRTTGRTDVIALAASTNIDTVDAGLFQLATIGNRVWDAVDGDGIQENGESGLNGVTVDLIGQSDDFEDGTLQGWTTAPVNPNPPQNLPDGGPGGVGDAFLQFSANGGSGAGGRLVIRNLSQWTGDLSRTDSIGANVKNLGSTDLLFRIAVNGPGGWFASTNAAAQAMAAGTDWSWLAFSLDPADFTNAFGQGGTDLAATLAEVSELRLLHSAAPNFRADPIVASAGVDNITALVDSQTTAGDGNYSFSVLPGSYHVQFITPAGRVLSP